MKICAEIQLDQAWTSESRKLRVLFYAAKFVVMYCAVLKTNVKKEYLIIKKSFLSNFFLSVSHKTGVLLGHLGGSVC